MALIIMFEPGMQRVDNITEGAAFNACKEIAQDARRYAPKVTGALRRSIRARRTKGGGRVYVGTTYWHYVEYGTEPHYISVPQKSKKVLYNKRTRQVFGKSVNHPGAKASMYIRKAFFKKRSMAQLMIPDLPDPSVIGSVHGGAEWYG